MLWFSGVLDNLFHAVYKVIERLLGPNMGIVLYMSFKGVARFADVLDKVIS